MQHQRHVHAYGIGDADRELECCGQRDGKPPDGEPHWYRLERCGGFLPLHLPNFSNDYRRAVGNVCFERYAVGRLQSDSKPELRRGSPSGDMHGLADCGDPERFWCFDGNYLTEHDSPRNGGARTEAAVDFSSP